MNLHNIRGTGPTALIWFAPVGGNGQLLGRANAKRWHLYPIERRLPPELGTQQRYGWEPWHLTGTEDVRAPLCGPFKTTARWPRLATWAWPTDKCRDCDRIARELGTPGQEFTTVRAHDPWNRVDWIDRPTMPDPVTGL